LRGQVGNLVVFLPINTGLHNTHKGGQFCIFGRQHKQNLKPKPKPKTPSSPSRRSFPWKRKPSLQHPSTRFPHLLLLFQPTTQSPSLLIFLSLQPDKPSIPAKRAADLHCPPPISLTSAFLPLEPRDPTFPFSTILPLSCSSLSHHSIAESTAFQPAVDRSSVTSPISGIKQQSHVNKKKRVVNFFFVYTYSWSSY